MERLDLQKRREGQPDGRTDLLLFGAAPSTSIYSGEGEDLLGEEVIPRAAPPSRVSP